MGQLKSRENEDRELVVVIKMEVTGKVGKVVWIL